MENHDTKSSQKNSVMDYNTHSHYYPKRRTLGQKAADVITEFGGSWTFIIIFSVIVVVWIAINLYQLFFNTWDPYPFILLNLGLSMLAAIQAPIILMSQNRQTQRDRAKTERDYLVNRKAEREIEGLQKDLEEIKETLTQIKSKI
ncbi:MAG: DUF1003 domain-containing protein [Candidatus Micrarchaeota archaeon]|nr:DUF1003 domain-containing protein [Candidatus Micrarchaeota archaeon]